MNLWDFVSPKIPTKNYRDFCPGSLLEGKAEISVTFGWDFGRNNGLMNSFWIKLTFRGRYWILILFSKPSFKFQKCLYTCKAAAVAQSSLVGCKIFRPSWDVKLVLLGPRHPFFFDPFLFLLRSSICPFYSDFYVKTIGSPHLFVNVTHTIHWDSETFQWTLAKHWIEMAIPEIGFSIICVF